MTSALSIVFLCALGGCGNQLPTSQETVTVTASPSSSLEVSSADGSASAEVGIDRLSVVKSFQSMDYGCHDEKCYKDREGISYRVDIDADSVDYEVKERRQNSDFSAYISQGIEDLGNGLSRRDFDGHSWDEISAWIRENAMHNDQTMTAGSWKVAIEYDADPTDRSWGVKISR